MGKSTPRGTFRGTGAAATLAAVALGCAGACSRPAEPACAALRPGGSRATNLVLVVDDTLRRDRLGAYGGPARTPSFDRFAADNLLFTRASTQAPWTKPSIATLFTGLYPAEHGVLTRPETDAGERVATEVLAGELTTLAELLRGAGFRTAAFVANPWLDARFGFDQGFEVYDDSFAAWDTPGAVVTQAALDWVSHLDGDAPFFLYLHYMDSHRPYPPVSRFDLVSRYGATLDDERPVAADAARQIAELVRLEGGLSPVRDGGLEPSIALVEAAYDAGVERFDAALGDLLARLRERASWERTALVVTSDHGEALFTRGYGNHGLGLYEDEVGVPLAARLPGVDAATSAIACPAGLIDLLPTLCDYLALDCPERSSGQSWIGPAPADGVRGSFVLTGAVMDRPDNRAVRGERYKLLLQPQGGIDGAGDLLFDLVADPGETRNLLGRAEMGGVAADLERAAAALEPAGRVVEPLRIPLDAPLEQRLRALGYVR